MRNSVAKLKAKIKAVRKLTARGGKGYFSNENKGLNDNWQDELAAMRAKNAQRWKDLETKAMANIVRGQRELERVAA